MYCQGTCKDTYLVKNIPLFKKKSHHKENLSALRYSPCLRVEKYVPTHLGRADK